MKRITASVAGALLALTANTALVLSQDKPESREDVEKIVREYLLENPEIIMDAIQILQERRETAAVMPVITKYRQWLENDPMSTVMGNPEGTVTLVEFFDFRCGYCRRHFPVLKQLVSTNPDLKIIFKQYPILDQTPGGTSHQAALVALYANSVGKGALFHDKMMTMPGKVTDASIRATASSIGLDLGEMDATIKTTKISSALDSSIYVGRELRFNGTPSYIVGDRVFSGGVGLDKMQEAINQARTQKSR